MTGSTKDNVKKKYKTADQLFFRYTGTHLHTVVKKVGNTVISSITRSLEGGTDNLGSCYVLLGVRPDAPDLVIKAAFRAFTRELHPDTGIKPDAEKFTRVVEAYREIMLARLQAEGGEVPPEDPDNDGAS